MTSRCTHPRVVASFDRPQPQATVERVSAQLDAALQLDEWTVATVSGDVRLWFPECSWCRKPRRRWWHRKDQAPA